jgi:peptide/nickel transport system substrate-binding protein
MKVVRIIASNLQAAGINVTPTFPDYNNYNDKLSGGNNLDPAISNSNSKVSNTVWSPWSFHPVQKGLQTSGNHGKFNSPEVFRIVDELDGTPS